MKKILKLNESQLKRVVAESMRRVLKEVKINENNDFTFDDSHMINPSTHRQIIKYKGKEIGYLLYKERNWLSPVDEIWLLPDVDYGMDIPQKEKNGQNYVNVKDPWNHKLKPVAGRCLLDGAQGWIDFKVFKNNSESAMSYAKENFDKIAYLFEYGDYD